MRKIKSYPNRLQNILHSIGLGVEDARKISAQIVNVNPIMLVKLAKRLLSLKRLESVDSVKKKSKDPHQT
jgi:hypothetical protein